MRKEALDLADWLDKSIDADDWGELAKYYQWCHENVSPMMRRLVEENQQAEDTIARLMLEINRLQGMIDAI